MGNQCRYLMQYHNKGHKNLRHSTDHVLTVKQLQIVGSSHFNHPTSAAVRIIIDSPCDQHNDRGAMECYSYPKF
jgi:hypothetical protein